MRSWQSKALVDGVKSFIPMQGALRAAYRALKPYESEAWNDRCLIDDVVSQIHKLTHSDFAIDGKTVVEIGTGWKPVLPLLYNMCGADKVITVDQERLLDAHTLRRAAQFVGTCGESTAALNGAVKRPLAALELLDSTDGLEGLLSASRIEYRAPFKFQDLPTRSADYIVSRDVLEHIPEDLLRSMFRESRRILRPGGALCHTIDVSDHWEHKDKSISKVNFLQYEGMLWKLAGLNPQNYQNRLRRFEYMEMLEDAGFRVIAATGVPDPSSLAALRSMQLCDRYANVPHRELAVLYTTIIAVPA